MTDEQAERMIALLERLTKAIEEMAYQPNVKAVTYYPHSVVNATNPLTSFSVLPPDEVIGKPLPPSDDDDPLTWRMNTGG